MAQVICTEASGKLAPIFGEIQAPIASIIMERAKMSEEKSIARKIFKRRPITSSVAAFGGMTAVDSFAPVGENGAYPTGGMEAGYFKNVRPITWRGSFSISHEAAADQDIIKMKQAPESFFMDYERKIERFFAQLIGEATKGTTSFTLNGIGYDTTGADGVCAFSKAHPSKMKGANQSNLYADAFSADALGGLATAMQNVKDDNGNIMDLAPNTIIIPNVQSLKKAVFAAIGSSKVPGSGNNDYNYLFENWNVYVWSYLNQFITANSSPYIIMDDAYCEAADCGIYLDREELTVHDEIGDVDNIIWKGLSRFSGAIVDWRGMFIGGVTGGSSL